MATLLEEILSLSLDKYNSNDCYKDDWLYNKNFQWNIMPSNSVVNYVSMIYNNGFVKNCYVANISYAVRPTTYLNSNITLLAGTGTSIDPYNLKVS